MDFDQRNWWTYYKEMGTVLILFMVLIFGTRFVFSLGIPDSLQVPLVLVPMLAFIAGIWVFVRLVRRVDEWQRQRLLRDLAVSFGVTGFVTFTYGMLEAVGLPRLSMFSVWWVMTLSWVFVSIYSHVSGR